jgi:hypothetical protein
MPQGNVRALATSLTQSGQRRRFRCHTCATPFSATRATVFFDLRTSEDQIRMALKRLRVRGDWAGISLGLGVTAETVVGGLRRAAPQADASHRQRLRALPGTQGQLAERWHWIERQHAGETDAAGESGPDSEAGQPWGWSSLAPAGRWRLAAIVGPRTRDTAQAVVAAPQAGVVGLPACCRAGFPGSLAARLAACPVVTTFARPGQRGRPRQPRGAPPPARVYGPWVPQQPQGQLLTLSTRVVLGAARLTQRGLTLSTAWVERVHLTWRQALAPLARQTASFWKDRERRRPRVVRCQGFYHMARPHMRVRQPVPPPARPCRGAIQPRWRERTPAMAAGLTDHVWTFRELLTAKCEPLDSQSISG